MRLAERSLHVRAWCPRLRFASASPSDSDKLSLCTVPHQTLHSTTFRPGGEASIGEFSSTYGVLYQVPTYTPYPALFPSRHLLVLLLLAALTYIHALCCCSSLFFKLKYPSFYTHTLVPLHPHLVLIFTLCSPPIRHRDLGLETLTWPSRRRAITARLDDPLLHLPTLCSELSLALVALSRQATNTHLMQLADAV